MAEHTHALRFTAYEKAAPPTQAASAQSREHSPLRGGANTLEVHNQRKQCLRVPSICALSRQLVSLTPAQIMLDMLCHGQDRKMVACWDWTPTAVCQLPPQARLHPRSRSWPCAALALGNGARPNSRPSHSRQLHPLLLQPLPQQAPHSTHLRF